MTSINIEAGLRWAQQTVDDPRVGYSQPNRTNPASQDLDCSRFVQLYIQHCGSPITSGLVWTGNMAATLPPAGWAWVPGVGGLRRGDVLWKVGHTAIFRGDGARLEAWIDESGRVTGATPGDQTGQEVRAHAPWNDIAWIGYFRAPTSTTSPEEDDMTPAQAAQLNRIEQYLKVPGHPFGFPQATHNAVGSLMARVAAQDAAIQALATAQGLDPQAITRAIDQAVTDALNGITLQITKEN